MKKIALKVALLILALTLGIAGSVWAYSETWNFDDSGLDYTKFFVDDMSNGAFSLNDGGGNLQITKSETTDLGGGYGIGSRFNLQGNFDIKVDYNLLSSINSGDSIYFGFGQDTPDQWVNLQRSNFQPYPGNTYQVYLNAGELLYSNSTTATSGTLQWRRAGSEVAASVNGSSIYYFDFTSDDVHFWMGVAQNGPNDSFGSLSVSFDNLSVADNITNPVPLPGAAWLLGSGLLGLAAWRRRRGKS